MKKPMIYAMIICCFLQGNAANAFEDGETRTSSDLESMAIKLLLPKIESHVVSFYAPYLTIQPTVSPYYGAKIAKVNCNVITVEVLPYVGPHISVGRDQISFEISNSGKVALKDYKHIESHELPEHLRSLLKAPLP